MSGILEKSLINYYKEKNNPIQLGLFAAAAMFLDRRLPDQFSETVEEIALKLKVARSYAVFLSFLPVLPQGLSKAFIESPERVLGTDGFYDLNELFRIVDNYNPRDLNKIALLASNAKTKRIEDTGFGNGYLFTQGYFDPTKGMAEKRISLYISNLIPKNKKNESQSKLISEQICDAIQSSIGFLVDHKFENSIYNLSKEQRADVEMAISGSAFQLLSRQAGHYPYLSRLLIPQKNQRLSYAYISA